MTDPNQKSLDYFHGLQAKKPHLPRSRPGSGLLGLFFGATTALAFSIVAESITAWFLPGVTLENSPFGYFGNLIAYATIGAIAGWLCCYPVEEVDGFIYAVPLCAAFFELILLLSPYVTLQDKYRLAIGLLVPVIGFTCIALVFLILIRWSVDRQSGWSNLAIWHPKRSLPVLVTLLAAAVIGRFALVPGSQLAALRATDTLLKENIPTASSGTLPTSLTKVTGNIPNSQDFSSIATTDFSLEIIHSIRVRAYVTDRIGAPANSEYGIVVLARFTNDWALACLYDIASNQIFICQSLSPQLLPRPTFRFGTLTIQ